MPDLAEMEGCHEEVKAEPVSPPRRASAVDVAHQPLDFSTRKRHSESSADLLGFAKRPRLEDFSPAMAAAAALGLQGLPPLSTGLLLPPMMPPVTSAALQLSSDLLQSHYRNLLLKSGDSPISTIGSVLTPSPLSIPAVGPSSPDTSFSSHSSVSSPDLPMFSSSMTSPSGDMSPSLMTAAERKQRKKPTARTEKEKDEAYWERRRKNNLAAKRSRDARRQKEDNIGRRSSILERENVTLKLEAAALRSEIAKMKMVLYNM